MPRQARARMTKKLPLIFPNEAAIVRLIGAVLLEQNDEWQLQHRYMQVEAMAEVIAPASAADPRRWIAHWEVTMARMPTAILSMVCALPTMLPGAVNAQYPQRAILPANCELKLNDAAILFYGLELNDGCIVYFDPSIKQVKLTVITLTLHGQSTIDLTPRASLPLRLVNRRPRRNRAMVFLLSMGVTELTGRGKIQC
jgi:hypothetical protein